MNLEDEIAVVTFFESVLGREHGCVDVGIFRNQVGVHSSTVSLFSPSFLTFTWIVSPRPSTASPRQSKPGPTLPIVAGTKIVASINLLEDET